MSYPSILLVLKNMLARGPWSRHHDPVSPFFALSADLFCITRLDGHFRRVNPAFIAALGHAEPELLGMNMIDLIHPDERDAAVSAMTRLGQGDLIVALEARFRCACGSYKSLSFTSTRFPGKGLVYTVAQDRTKHNLDTESLLQSEARCDRALESTSDAIFAVDRDWRILRVNHQAERLWMRHRSELLGCKLWDLFPEAVGGPFYLLYDQVMRTGIPANIEEFYPFPPLDRWFEVNAYPRPEGIAVYFRDVTERRLADEKIKRVLQEKEVLLREVHHRVKNNLQVICSMLRLQERQLSDDNLLQALRDCRERVMAMAMLHDQLHRAKDFSNINLGEYIRNLAASLFCSYGVNSLDIGLDMDIEDIPVAVDTAIPCGLIVNELISNSLRHAFLEGRKGRVALGLHAWPGGRVELTIADNGQGFQASVHTAGSRSLGLWLVDLLSDQIGAALERSTEGGTRYRLVFQEVAPPILSVH